MDAAVVVGGLRRELRRDVLEPAVDDVAEPAATPGLRSAVAQVEDELGTDPLRVLPSSMKGTADPPALTGEGIGRGLQQDLPRVGAAASDVAGSG